MFSQTQRILLSSRELNWTHPNRLDSLQINIQLFSGPETSFPQLGIPREPPPLKYQDLRKKILFKLNLVLCSANILPGLRGIKEFHTVLTADETIGYPRMWQHPSFL